MSLLFLLYHRFASKRSFRRAYWFCSVVSCDGAFSVSIILKHCLLWTFYCLVHACLLWHCKHQLSYDLNQLQASSFGSPSKNRVVLIMLACLTKIFLSWTLFCPENNSALGLVLYSWRFLLIWMFGSLGVSSLICLRALRLQHPWVIANHWCSNRRLMELHMYQVQV